MEENINKIYDYPFNNLKTDKEYAPVIISVLKVFKEQKEPISIQSALDILEDSKKILTQITAV
jgi:hypothetical protein